MCLSTVLNHIKIMFSCNIHDRIHVTRLTIEMHRHNSLCSWSDSLFYKARINIKCSDIWFYKYNLSSGIGSSQRCGDKCVRRNDHLITLSDSKALQGKHQRIQAITYTNTILSSTEIGKSFFKRLVFLTFHIPGSGINFLESLADLLVQFCL